MTDTPDETPWFRRLGPDGKPEPHVARGDKGEILVLDANGWAASFRDGTWHDGILFSHDALAEFAPVTARSEVYSLYEEARARLAALGGSGSDDLRVTAPMRYPRRAPIAAFVLLTVILALALMVVFGPSRYFAGNRVRADLDCHVSHCNRASDDMKWRLTGLDTH